MKQYALFIFNLSREICFGLVHSLIVSEYLNQFLKKMPAENEFNCPDDCGLYAPYDTVGPFLHDDCDKVKKEIDPADHDLFEIDGGFKSRYPMPWMVKQVFEFFVDPPQNVLGFHGNQEHGLWWQLDQQQFRSFSCSLLL